MKPALLLIDLQADYLASPGLQPDPARLVTQTAALLQGWRAQQWPVIHVWTTVRRDEPDRRLPHWQIQGRWRCEAGTEGHAPPAALRPLAGEPIIHKQGFNAYANGELEAALNQLHCDAVVLAGLHLHACVRTAAVESLERRRAVIIVEDAVASNDPVHAAAVRRWLAERCVRFEPMSSALARLRGQSPGGFIHHSPRAVHEVLFEVQPADAAEIARATSLVTEATGAWHCTAVSERAARLTQVSARLEATAPNWARQMALELGKPFAHGLEEIRRAAVNVRDVVRRAATFHFQVRETGGLVRHQPLGVVAVISPWNNPVAIPLGKIAPALMYGNGVVWKPAPATTRISEALLRLLRECGIPAELVQLLRGDHTTAQQLAGSNRIDAVTFTGSTYAGQAMQEICARRLAPLQAELGGNNAAILWDDADVPAAAADIARGAFGFAGQRCTANRRVIVNEQGFDRALAALKQAAEHLVWGDPLDSDAEIGPLLNVARREEHARRVAQAVADGAGRLEFTHAADAEAKWVREGAYARPVIACCDEPDHPLVQEESMSPLLVVQRARDFAEALTLSNGVRHGLAAALFSNAPARQQEFLTQSRAGILRLNASTAGADVTLPFGGWKASGIGPPEHGTGDALFYTRIQTVYGA
ncbi:MAG TPA: aldehyde dehydrogenase family protein [Verrucomicrobiae bacterium]|nr:aldehyde dehydrogenase family protein [Verrucomicrobiae bacterium]